MMLTNNFSIEELTHTDTDFKNIPDQPELEKLLYLATYVLEPIRRQFGAVKINSAFRSKQVNDKINGAASSQHMLGEASDIFPLEANIDAVFKWCCENLNYGQCIRESRNGAEWIHLSLPRIGKKNMMAMEMHGGVYHNMQKEE